MDAWLSIYLCLVWAVFMDAWLKTKRVNTPQNDVNNAPAPITDNMDIDTTPKQEDTKIKSPSKTKSPSKPLPPDLQNCFVLLSPCPTFPPTQNTPPPHPNIPNGNTLQDKPILVDPSVNQSHAPNPAVDALATDQPAKPSPKKRKLSPEEKQAREDAKKAKEEERKLQAKQREDAKNKKEEEKRLLALAREEEKKKRDEEKRVKDQAKEEARLKKEAEKKARDDAKLQKDLEKKAKEEARLQKLQEKQKQEEEEKRKKERQQAVLANFIKVAPVEAPRKPQKVDPDLLIQPFVCGSEFVFPPSYLRTRQPSPGFDDAIAHKDGQITIEKLQVEFREHMHGKRNRKRDKKRRAEKLQGLPPALSNMKLLRFHDNVRPAYYGTFSKRSAVLTGRRPLRTDDAVFDYEVDSDAEWEDEGEGEELSESEGEKDKEEEESEEEEEDKWVVPDGYLSEDEGMDSDDEKSKRAMKLKAEEGGEGGDADTASSSSGKRPAEHMERDKTKREKREKKPCIISTTFDPDSLDSSAKAILTNLSVQPLVDCPIDLDWKPPADPEEQSADSRSSKQVVPDSLMPALILYIHTHPMSLHKIIEGFHSENTQVSKRQLELKIREIAVKVKKSSWQVREEVVKSYDVTLPEIIESKPVPPKTPQKNMTDFFAKAAGAKNQPPNSNSNSNSNSNPNSNSSTPTKKTPTKNTPTKNLPTPSSHTLPSENSTKNAPTENGCHTTPKRNIMDMFQKHQKTQG
eukprot:Phypoly_transcript_03998.p1 GENE.Phypoly_transcript_03998~~Phypoly_transcript_03998.p1  ORF type:complete len:743 (+),score=218.56 Phypoly_transcript_03998:3-2231(+)